MKEFTYKFKTVEACNMCCDSPDKFRLLGQRLNQSQGFRPAKKIGITTRIMQCSTCGLIFSNPMPVPANIQDHYGVPPENYWKENYFEIDKNYFLGEITWLEKLKQLTPGMKSLDIGAGLGKQMIALQNRGFDAYGFEPSIEFYNRAIEKMGIRKEKLSLGRMEEVTYDAASFDFISFGAVLEHLYDPAGALRIALKWLKPDGLIHVEVPNSAWLTNKIINIIYKLTGSGYVGNISPMHNPYHLYEFSLESFTRNAKINDYEVRDHCYYVCDTFLPKILDPVLKPLMNRTDTGMQLCVWLRKRT